MTFATASAFAGMALTSAIVALAATLNGALAAAPNGALAATLNAAPKGKLSPADIQATFFNGQPFTAATPAHVRFKMTFTADGKMKREPLGAGNKGDGTWKLSKEGFCTAWSGGQPSCFTVVAAGNNQWSVLRGSIVMATWSK